MHNGAGELLANFWRNRAVGPKVLECSGGKVTGDRIGEVASVGLTPLPIPGTLHAPRRNSMWADFAWQKSNYS